MFIVVTGPESSGKTSMSEYLGKHLDLKVVDEYARVYLDSLGRRYSLDDIVEIGLKQKAAVERSLDQHPGHVISDTFMLELTVWTRERFGHEPDVIRQIRHTMIPDLYILCKPDIPWEPDPLRENPDDRDRLFTLYEALVQHSGAEYVLATGEGPERNEKVERVVRQKMKKDIP